VRHHQAHHPCGIALGRSAREAYERALATDRTSAFGSVIAFTVAVDRPVAEAMRDLFVEVVVAPDFADDAVPYSGKRRTCGWCGFDL